MNCLSRPHLTGARRFQSLGYLDALESTQLTKIGSNGRISQKNMASNFDSLLQDARTFSLASSMSCIFERFYSSEEICF
jgi:hypothetical protein